MKGPAPDGMPVVLQYDGLTIEIHAKPDHSAPASVEVICLTEPLRISCNGQEVFASPEISSGNRVSRSNGN